MSFAIAAVCCDAGKSSRPNQARAQDQGVNERCRTRYALKSSDREQHQVGQQRRANDSLRHVDRVDHVANTGDDGDFTGSSGNVQRADNQWREQRVQLVDFVLQLNLPQRLHAGNVGLAENLFVLLPAVPVLVAAIGQPVGGRKHRAAGDNRHDEVAFSHSP